MSDGNNRWRDRTVNKQAESKKWIQSSEAPPPGLRRMKSLSGYGSTDYVVGQPQPVGLAELGDYQPSYYPQSLSNVQSNTVRSPAELPATDMVYLVELPGESYPRNLSPQTPQSARSPPPLAPTIPATSTFPTYQPYQQPFQQPFQHPYQNPLGPDPDATALLSIERPNRPNPLDHLSYDLPLSAQPSPDLEPTALVRADTFNYNQLRATVERDANHSSKSPPVITINEPEETDAKNLELTENQLISRQEVLGRTLVNEQFLLRRKEAREAFRKKFVMQEYKSPNVEEEEEDIYGA